MHRGRDEVTSVATTGREAAAALTLQKPAAAKPIVSATAEVLRQRPNPPDDWAVGRPQSMSGARRPTQRHGPLLC